MLTREEKKILYRPLPPIPPKAPPTSLMNNRGNRTADREAWAVAATRKMYLLAKEFNADVKSDGPDWFWVAFTLARQYHDGFKPSEKVKKRGRPVEKNSEEARAARALLFATVGQLLPKMNGSVKAVSEHLAKQQKLLPEFYRTRGARGGVIGSSKVRAEYVIAKDEFEAEVKAFFKWLSPKNQPEHASDSAPNLGFTSVAGRPSLWDSLAMKPKD